MPRHWAQICRPSGLTGTLPAAASSRLHPGVLNHFPIVSSQGPMPSWRRRVTRRRLVKHLLLCQRLGLGCSQLAYPLPQASSRPLRLGCSGICDACSVSGICCLALVPQPAPSDRPNPEHPVPRPQTSHRSEKQAGHLTRTFDGHAQRQASQVRSVAFADPPTVRSQPHRCVNARTPSGPRPGCRRRSRTAAGRARCSASHRCWR